MGEGLYHVQRMNDMADFRLMRSLQKGSTTKIVLLVMDGLGGLSIEPGGSTELEAAATPNLDRLASEGCLGQTIPIRRGITPGSGPAHLSLFGYDPVEFEVGRGVLEAIGVGMQVSAGDVAARGNFCTVDAAGEITDRRAGRISSEEAAPIVERLARISLPGVTARVRHVREYRFAVVMQGENLHPNINDTDPQQTGVPPLDAVALDEASRETARLFNEWIGLARDELRKEARANALTLRGFSTDPMLPQITDVYGLRAACVAVYPMYRGVARLVGMDVQEFKGESPVDEFKAAGGVREDYDFFFIHIKKTDSKGEDGDFEGKKKIIEEVDAAIPSLLELKPEVLAVTGDHSTPSRMRVHSWHPVPLLIWAPATVRADRHNRFGEQNCAAGSLGTFPGPDLMPLLMAHAGRLEKFGA
jgi:2,3-bisphosphoglycerate-independent phosphoglycerate mutase